MIHYVYYRLLFQPHLADTWTGVTNFDWFNFALFEKYLQAEKVYSLNMNTNKARKALVIPSLIPKQNITSKIKNKKFLLMFPSNLNLVKYAIIFKIQVYNNYSGLH